jgi:cystathionine beta-lyase/cystathionine gamma-synthase
LERINRTTQKIYEYLKDHPKVESIIYPFDPEFEQYELARKQMKEAPGLISVSAKLYTAEDIEKFCDNLMHFKMAVSWGGHESLIIPKLATMKAENFDPSNRDHRMLRIYVGLEEADYLIEDLDRM